MPSCDLDFYSNFGALNDTDRHFRLKASSFMSKKRRILANASWNWAGMAASMAAGFVTAPFLVSRLGETNYGLWIIIASFTSYFGMLDLGVRGAVGRQLAFHLARGDRMGVNGVLGTSLLILSGAGLVAFACSLGAASIITRLFEIPPGQVAGSRTALVLIGVNLALWLPLNLFDATLWAHQRFDLINAIDIAAVTLRTTLTFALIGQGHGLVTLAWLNLISLAGAQAVKGVMSFRIDPRLRVLPDDANWAATRDLLGFGIWYFLITGSRTLTTQASPLIVGAQLGIGAVTPYSIASRLIGYSGALIVAGTGVLTPIATALHAEGSGDRQRWLLIEGGKYCASLSLFLVIFFLCFGRSLISAWMGPNFAAASSILSILALGEALPMSQWVTHGLILGMGRHRPLALANLAECVVAVALAVVLAGPLGLIGICYAFALPAVACRGIFQLGYGCRLLELPIKHYLARVIVPAVAAAAIPATLLASGLTLAPPASPVGLIVWMLLYSATYGISCAIVLVGPGRLRTLGALAVQKLQAAETR